MGRELYDAFPVYARAFDEVCEALDRHLAGHVPHPVAEVVFTDPEGWLDRTVYTQSGLFAVETALFRLVESWGVRPDVVAGHSIGELTAAHIAGVLGLEDAAKLVAARARLMQSLPAGGAMITTTAPAETVTGLLTERTAVAAYNSPANTVISGEEGEVAAIREALAEQGHRVRELTVSHAFHSPLMDPVLDEFAAVADTLVYEEPRIPFVTAGEGDPLTPEYWARHIRDSVRFEQAVRTLAGQGVTTYLELGPTPHLTSAVNDTLDTTACVPTLRANEPEPHALLTAVATLHTRGTSLDWPALLPGGRRVDLPTYAFQHQPYWLDTAPRTFDVTSAGLSAPEHPLLQGKLDLPGSGGAVFTGVISQKSQPWLSDHSIAGTVLMPGTGFVELALHAAQETGYAGIDELIIEAPLVIPAHGAVQLQVAVQADAGVTVHSRPEGDDPGIPWTRHASGTLTTAAEPADFDLAVWPPENARALALDAAYEAVAGAGYHYGPVFRGLRAAWTRGDEVFAEAALPEEHHEGAARYGIHPALLDTAFHASMLHGDHEGGEGRTMLPFAWNGVTLHAAGTPHIRVRVVRSGSGATTAQLADCTGAPVAGIRSVVARPAATERLAAPAPGAESLYRVEWHKAVTHPTQEEPATVPVSGVHDIAELVAASAGGSPVPGLIVLDVARAAAENDGGTEGPEGVHALTSHVLSVVQAWLAEPALDGTRLLAVTRGAVGVDAHDPVTDLAAAAVWGLMRAAQSEHPGRVVLVDVDDESADQVPAALSTGEPQLALRGGTAYVPRFVRGATDAEAGRTERDTTRRNLDPDGTVLVTGGTGSLGALVARRLVTEHGIRHLVLTSRRGPDAPGAPELEAELTALGAHVRVEACDVTDRAALAALLGTIADSAPLTAVVHTAGVLDDGVLTALTRERLSTVLRPKADAAWHLHELTKDRDLAAFVLFSSVSGLMGGAGQGNYAAANAYLNALAHRRRTEGRAALTLAWGLWDQAGGMTSGLTETDRKRLARGGLAALGPDEGLALFDAALSDVALRDGDALAVPVRLDYTALRAQASDGTLPHLLHGLVRRVRRAAVAPVTEAPAEEPLATRLAGLSAGEQEEILQTLIRSTAAQVLGLPAAESFPADAFFFEAGFDSLTAVELRNRLSEATAVRLSSTFVFDHPTPQLLAEQLRLELTTQED